jgi:GTP:adenosylcobinamide-phosphate guanylyltransferase
MNTERTKFCILAAGRGSRNTVIGGLHKALVPIENRPVLSYILDKVPLDMEIVLAVGYKKEQIKSYVREVHSNRDIKFIEVENYDGPGSGPGYSLLQCKQHLQCKFIFISADTMIADECKYDNVEQNWIGVSSVNPAESGVYCLAKGEKYLERLYYGTGSMAYIGIVGVKDYDIFWDFLSKNKIVKNEYQVIHGIEGLIKNKLLIKRYNRYYDTGNDASYYRTKIDFPKEIVPPKTDETIFIDNNKVVKYFADENKLSKRIERAKYIKNYISEIRQLDKNMYAYNFIDGCLLSNLQSEQDFVRFLEFYNNGLGSKSFNKTCTFLLDCESMYKTKTLTRANHYSGTDLDAIKKINGIKVKPIMEILEHVDWDEILEKSSPRMFHGDLQPENILFNRDTKDFNLIDWRETFGSSTEIGDCYYDLSKLYHALIINGQTILKGLYSVDICSSDAFLEYNIRSNLMNLLQIFKTFCVDNEYDWRHVQLLGILHYINIAPFYDNYEEGRYGKFLFLLGKMMLTKHFEKKELEYIL